MADLNFTPVVRACKKCGALDRYPSGSCRPCRNASNAAYHAVNKDQIKAYQSAYSKENRDRVNAYGAAWRAANPEKRKASVDAYSRANKEKINALQAVYRAENPKKIAATGAAWRARNPEKSKANAAAWKAANPEARRAHKINRRALSLSVGGTITKATALILFNLQRGKCPVCKVGLDAGYHIDHVLALSKGGSNSPDNLQLLCPPCNLKKGTKHPIDFMQSRGFLL